MFILFFEAPAIFVNCWFIKVELPSTKMSLRNNVLFWQVDCFCLNVLIVSLHDSLINENTFLCITTSWFPSRQIPHNKWVHSIFYKSKMYNKAFQKKKKPNKKLERACRTDFKPSVVSISDFPSFHGYITWTKLCPFPLPTSLFCSPLFTDSSAATQHVSG